MAIFPQIPGPLFLYVLPSFQEFASPTKVIKQLLMPQELSPCSLQNIRGNCRESDAYVPSSTFQNPQREFFLKFISMKRVICSLLSAVETGIKLYKTLAWREKRESHLVFRPSVSCRQNTFIFTLDSLTSQT